MKLRGIIFDLDGVLVSTDQEHFLAWKMLADDLGIYFDKEINIRQRGVSRMESLEVLLEQSSKKYSVEEKEKMAIIKNNYYVNLIESIAEKDVLTGVFNFLIELKKRNILLAIGSSSKNAKKIITNTKLISLFDYVADGTMVNRSKPYPDVFLKAAEGLGLKAENCLVVEDADAGVDAGINANMKVLAVSSAKDNVKAWKSATDLNDVNLDDLIDSF